MRLVPTGRIVINNTAYPDKEVKKIVLAELAAAEINDGLVVTVKHCGSSHAGGWWRGYWYRADGEDRPQIQIRLPKPGVAIGDYKPYFRKREQGRSFPLATWQEALVAVAAHEAEHHRQYRGGERRGTRGSGTRRSQVEVRCDLAAYRAWLAYREAAGKETRYTSGNETTRRW